MGRLVTLVLVTGEGLVLGELPPFQVEPPWWSEVASVVTAARAQHGADVTVLRILQAAPDGAVTYVAELTGDPPPPDHLQATAWRLDDDPRRLPWARPGGPAADLAWADGALDQAGRPRAGRPLQLRTWNLSSIWRLPTAAGDVWLKVVPPLMAHEGALLDALAGQGAPVPPLVAYDGAGRALLDHVPGENQWAAPPERLLAMVDILVGIQAGWRSDDNAARLLALGPSTPDWRRRPFVAAAQETVAGWSTALPAEARTALDRLVDGLDRRFADLTSCGLPDTLVHGDAHPGNFRSDGQSLVLLDWGDAGLGHPLLDLPAFLERVDAQHRADVERAWLAAWSRVEPGSDPARASRLIQPLAALRQAIVYRRFLEAFEPAERVYHEADVPRWLLTAAALA